MKDRRGQIWIPLEYKKDRRAAENKVIVIKDFQFVKTIDDLPSFPIKVIEGHDVHAVLSAEDGVTGKVTFIKESDFSVAKILDIEGDIQDAVFDDTYLYVVSNITTDGKNSNLYRIQLDDFSSEKTIVESGRIYSIEAHLNELYLGVYSGLEGQSHLAIYDKDLGLIERIPSSQYPFDMVRKDNFLLILHVDLASVDKEVKSVLSRMDVRTRQIETLQLPQNFYHLSLVDDKAVVTSLASKTYVEVDIDAWRETVIEGEVFFRSNVVGK
ncbi:hypothetical protein WBG83_15450 [Paenibacillus sp. y28]